MPTFEKTQPLPVDASTLYEWHARPGAFERLTPPWSDIEQVHHSGGIADGARRVMKLGAGPVSMTWEALHRDHIAGEQFVDEQVRGPFRRWVHTHRFEERRPGHSWLVDHVDYQLPLGALGAMVGGARARAMLERIFAFRHRRTAEDLRRHAGASGRLTVAITGASGLIGRALSAFLSTGGHRVLRLVRDPAQAGEDAVWWSPADGRIDAARLEGIDAVVHLAGESVDGRWTQSKRRAIEASRVDGTDLLARALAGLDEPPRVLISASAVGWYGDTGDRVVDEDSPAGDDFLAGVCQRWEAAASPARAAGIRTVNLRLGVVLDPAGGALPKMISAVRYGLASRLGSGQQWTSWVDLDDVLGAIHFALTHDGVDGPINVCSPQPVTNAELMGTIGAVLGRPTLVGVPAAAIELAVGAQAARQTALASQRVQPTRLQEAGFQYFYPDVCTSLQTKLGATRTTGRPQRSVSVSTLIHTGLHGPG